MSLLSGGNKPKTIDSLKEYCELNGYTSEKTRFFIGEDYKEPRAFGIYKDEVSGDFVVYKNKDDGSRAVRYRGTDEAFAVGELYDRLQKEIINQKQHYYAGDIPSRSIKSYKNPYSDMDISSIRNGTKGERLSRTLNRTGISISGVLIYILILALSVVAMRCSESNRRSGYDGSDNYYYDNYDYNNSYDSGWSSDSWDSGYTDFGSDW